MVVSPLLLSPPLSKTFKEARRELLSLKRPNPYPRPEKVAYGHEAPRP